MGRPKKVIDEALVERLANAQCSNRQIAGRVGVNDKTIADRFSGQLASWRECGKTHLTEAMWDKAIEGKDGKMQIHLAKQYLGHSDRAYIELETPNNIGDPVELYASDPALMKRALQLERDIYDARNALGSEHAGTPGVSRLAVPSPPPSVGGNGDGSTDQPDGESGNRPNPG